MVGRNPTRNEKFRPAFEVFEGRKEDLPIGYQMIKCHMIFDVKLVENFRGPVT